MSSNSQIHRVPQVINLLTEPHYGLLFLVTKQLLIPVCFRAGLGLISLSLRVEKGMPSAEAAALMDGTSPFKYASLASLMIPSLSVLVWRALTLPILNCG
jgi:hypothetical protein